MAVSTDWNARSIEVSVEAAGVVVELFTQEWSEYSKKATAHAVLSPAQATKLAADLLAAVTSKEKEVVSA